jgi:lysophospholipase L1-like esterase
MPFAAGRDGQKIASDIDRFNAILKEEADKLGLQVVDVTTTSRLAKSQPDFVAEDGLHPSAVQYSVWVERILPVVQEIFP